MWQLMKSKDTSISTGRTFSSSSCYESELMSSTSHHRYPNRHSIIWYLPRPILLHQYPPIRIPRSSRSHLGFGSSNQTPRIPPHNLGPTTMGLSTHIDSIIHGNVRLPTPTRLLLKFHLSNDLLPRHYWILPFIWTWTRTCYLGCTF